MKMSAEQRKRGLAQVHDLKRRLADRDFPAEPDDDGADAEVVDIVPRIRETRLEKYDAAHPVLRHRRDIDG